jgi:hypothetical protein
MASAAVVIRKGDSNASKRVLEKLMKPSEPELKGLVYALTEKATETGGRWFMRPVPLGIGVLILSLILNLIFR